MKMYTINDLFEYKNYYYLTFIKIHYYFRALNIYFIFDLITSKMKKFYRKYEEKILLIIEI
jgi:hypothetical protein